MERYNLLPSEYNTLREELVGTVANDFNHEPGIYTAWIHNAHPISDVLRTEEKKIFPKITDFVSDRVEQRSLFMAMVDTRGGRNVIVHGARLTGRSLVSDGEVEIPSDDMGSTDMIMVDELVSSGQGVTSDVFRQYYTTRGIDLDKCATVETNFRVGDKTRTDNGHRPAMLGYVAIFNLMHRLSEGIQDNYVFAFVNRSSRISFKSHGIVTEPFMGRDDLVVYGSNGAVDIDFTPVGIPLKELGEDFGGRANLALPETTIGAVSSRI